MVVAGLLLGAVGTDVATGQLRFTMGAPALLDGIGFVPLAIGLFALEESVRRALLFSGGDPTTFVTHPVSATLLVIAGVLMMLAAAPFVTRARQRLR